MKDQGQERLVADASAYAVIFRTHIWDDFIQRQLERLIARVHTGHVYVLVDETSGAVAGINHDRIVRITENDMLELGFARAGSGNMLWYNGDYPLYYFAARFPQYSHVFQIEYDSVINTDIDAMMREIMADGVDFVANGNLGPGRAWFWRDTCLAFYTLDEVEPKLLCVSAYSRKALILLGQQRIAQAARHAAAPGAWPICEGFVGSESKRLGLACRDLSCYGRAEECIWWPPNLEREIPQFNGNAFVHPILDEDRYIHSVLKHPTGFSAFVDLNSVVHRKLRKLSMSRYLSSIMTGFVQKSARRLNTYAAR